MILIGLTGKIGCGKSTVSKYLADYYTNTGACQLYQFAFADALKSIAISFLGLSHNDCYTQEGKASYNVFWGMTNREILQRIGTNAFRDGFHPDTWTKILEIKIMDVEKANRKPQDIIIVDDVRFDNEAEMLRKHGGKIINIERSIIETEKIGATVGLKDHPSEKGISSTLVDYTIVNNCYLTELKEKVLQALRELYIANPEIIR